MLVCELPAACHAIGYWTLNWTSALSGGATET